MNTRKRTTNKPNNDSITKELRVPRPMGTTEISKAYNHSLHTPPKNKELNENHITLQSLQSHIIKHYINNNYMYNYIPYTIEQFSSITNIPQSLILEHLYDINEIRYNMLENEGQRQILGVIGKGLQWGFLESQQAIMHHAQMLLRDQAGSYKPFISSEVTKALKLTLEATQQGINLMNRFNPNPGADTAINIYNTNQQNMLSVHDAQMLINNDKSTAPLLSNPEARDALFLEHHVADMPEVNATLQVGVDASREGLSFVNMNSELLEEPHTDRRAKELNIDLESDNI